MIENSFLSFINNKCVHTTYLLILVHKRYMKCESTFVFYEYTQELATVGNDETLQSIFFSVYWSQYNYKLEQFIL